jgi:hypothetical protein
MRALRLLAPVITGLMLLLTYFLVQGTTPDAVLHERTLDALRQLIVNDAALQRDVLAARTGHLRNYDPLVRSVENMRDAAARLQTPTTSRAGRRREKSNVVSKRLPRRCATRTASSMTSSPATHCCRTR